MTTYIYKNIEVVLLDSCEMNDTEFRPVERNSYNGVEAFAATAELLAYIEANNIDTYFTYDDAYSAPSEDGTKIIYTRVKNIENEQHLIYEFVTKEYAEWDEFEREYLETTDCYYDRTSVRRQYLDRIDAGENLEKLRGEWDEEVADARPKHSMYDFCQDASFDALLEEAE